MKLMNMLKRAFYEPSMSISAPKIEIYGKKELVMTGCTHIAEFAPESVILSSSDMSVNIQGEHLELLLLAKSTVAVRGKIASIELSGGKKA